jgi:PAS domain-containing protein
MIELWGKGDSVLGKPLRQALPELERQPFFQILDEVYTSGKAYEANNAEVMRVVNGVPGLYYFNFTYKPLFNAAGQVYGILDVAIDVTEQVLSRKKVEESAAKYQGLFNSIDQGFCLIEMLFDENNKPIDYRFLEVNPTFSQQTGLKEAESKTAREMVPDLEIHWFEIYGKVALTGEPIRFVEFSQAMSRWFDVYAFRIGGAENGKVALLFTNISQRKKAEEALKESENQLKFAIEATELATWDYNPFTNRLRGNSRLKEWFDLSAEEEVELSIAIEVIAEQDRERVSRAIEQSLQYASGGLYDVEYTIVHPATQTPRIVRAKGRAWFGEDRIAYRFNGTLQDVTREALAKQTLQASEQKAQLLAQELAAANEELLAANEKIQSTNEELGVTNAYLTRTNVDLDNFIYTASHDLKAPISNIESLLQALLRTLPPECSLPGGQSVSPALCRSR